MPRPTRHGGSTLSSRRQVLNGIGVLTAAALLTACTQPQQPTPAAPGATGAPATGGAPAVNPSLTPAALGNVMNGIDQIQPWQEEFYKDLHRHPDVWGEEARTAEKVTKKLQEVGVDEILQIGGGVVGIVRNGDGRRVLFRADMDALPVTEATGLEYSSTEPGNRTSVATTRMWRPGSARLRCWPRTRAGGPAPISLCSSPVRRPARAPRR